MEMEMEMGCVVCLLLFFLFLVGFVLLVKKQRRHTKLPPGSMGLPYIGETLQLYSQNPNAFFLTRLKRYGEIFKTRLLNCSCIMLATPEAARFVFVTEAHRFKPTYPKSKMVLLGQSALFYHSGQYHAQMRKLVQGSLSLNIFRNLVSDIESLALSALESMSGRRVVNTFNEMKKYRCTISVSECHTILKPVENSSIHITSHPFLSTSFLYDDNLNTTTSVYQKPTPKPTFYNLSFKNIPDLTMLGRPLDDADMFTFNVAILSIFGQLDTCCKEMLWKNYTILDVGYNSLSIKLPGTLYSKSIAARKKLGQTLGEIISERKENKELMKDSLLGSLLNFKDENGEIWTVDQIADNIIGVLFAAQDTTASVLTWILKYIHDDPKLQENIRIEQKAIYESNKKGNGCLTWVQTREMPLTHMVINESLRMASIISFTFREAVEDVEYNGFLIPKGWKVLPLFRSIHHNPEFFNDPEKFDSSRFEHVQKPNTFMPFGIGAHACPGNEVAKLEMLIFIHHLVNNFKWEVVSKNTGVQYKPFPIPRGGLSAKFWKINHAN